MRSALSRRLASPLVLVGAVAGVMAVFDFWAIVFATNDEARFPLLARDVLTRGDWWFPQLNGAVYQNKPPLLAWLIAIASWPLGHVTALSAVLPSILAAVTLAVVICAAGRDMFGTDAGRCAGLVVATSQGFVVHARLAMPDMLLAVCFTLALWQGWRLTRERPGAWIAFYGATGAAFWTKGPAGLLPLLAVLVWALAGNRRRRLALLRLPRGLALLVAIVAPWPLIGALGHAAELRAAVVNDQLFWYLPQSFRVGALISPPQNAFGILFPWVLLTPLVIAQAVRTLRGRGGERDTVHLLLTWSAVVFVAVGLSGQQRVRYYLPLLAPVALLTGWWIAGVVVRHRAVTRIPWGAYAAVGGVLVVGGAVTAALRAQTRAQIAATWPAYVGLTLAIVVVGLVAAALVALSPAPRRRPRAFALACVVAAVAAAGAYRADTHRPTTEEFGRLEARVQGLAGAGGPVVVWDVADLPLNFYLGRPIVEVHTGEALARALDGGAAVAVVGHRLVGGADGPAGVTVLWRETLGPREVAVVTAERR
jgi:4-amino-4-deoxy-L-arabinose transferase-like glycosyltransferase